MMETTSVSVQGPLLQCYGVVVGFRSNSVRILAGIDSAFIPASQISTCNEPDLAYSLEVDEKHGLYTASIDSEQFIQTEDLNRLLDVLKLNIQHAVAERAVECLFVHAGVVAWHGRAIL